MLALGAPAEYGNVTGAVFNVVTRQGTNDFHGDANYYFQSQGLTGRNTTAEEECRRQRRGGCLAAGGCPFHREKFHDATFQLSGPIVKDKLWFFASYQFQTDAKTPGGSRSALLHRREGPPGLRQAQLADQPEAQARPRLPQRLLRPALHAQRQRRPQHGGA